METLHTSETSVHNYFTRQYIAEDNSEHHTRRRENLKSNKFELFYVLKYKESRYRLRTNRTKKYHSFRWRANLNAWENVCRLQGVSLHVRKGCHLVTRQHRHHEVRTVGGAAFHALKGVLQSTISRLVVVMWRDIVSALRSVACCTIPE
jgi:hypothetical protein